MEKIIYWANVQIADSGLFVKVTEREFKDIVSIANKGYGSQVRFDDESNLTKYYAITANGRKELVGFNQVLKEEE